MKSATISKSVIKKVVMEILQEPDVLEKLKRNFPYPSNVATKDDIKMILELMEKRFEAMDKRFEAMDKRFESLQREMDKRFEAVDKRFESLIREMNARFETMQKEMNTRFEAIDKRFEAINKRLNLITWVIGIGFTLLGGALITLIGLIIHLITKI